MVSDINFLFPQAVSDAFDKMMEEEEEKKSTSKMKHHYFNIVSAMKASLKNIDDQIDSIVLEKNRLIRNSQ